MVASFLFVCMFTPYRGNVPMIWQLHIVAGGSDKNPPTRWKKNIWAVINALVGPCFVGDEILPSDLLGVVHKPWNKDNPSMNQSGFHGSCHVWVERCHCSLGKKICSLGMMSTSYSSAYLHIPVSFIFWDVIQVLNFVHLDFLLLGML